uniref:Ribosomal protein L1 n=1 Tax=Ditylum brightwellii TaxID=49249 RepID=A0A7S2A612_9STRA|mmetsp:Transcript_8709/g.12987  ORF Transcript_8709/g.12987 Transcript_8709/m.12987 type:complete len:525 (+) Transcript_8709:170-1744(+)
MVAKTAKKVKSSTVSKELDTKELPSASNNKIDDALLERALKALLKHHERTASEKGDKQKLIGTDDESIQLQITLARVPQDPSSKPIRIDIPHPLHKVGEDEEDGDDALEEAEVCLIVKESSKPHIQKLISNFPKHLSHIKKVLGLDSLRKKYSRFEQRRELLHKYNFFMVDDRILPMVGKQLGKNFFETKKQPIPIKITREEALPFAIDRCLRATYMYISAGTCVTIKAGYTSMSVTKILSNIQSIISNAIPKLPRKWANICALSIKTASSTSLPFYNKTPEELIEIAKLAGVPDRPTKKDDALAKRKREEKDEEKSKEEEANKEKKRQKQELAAKSPLLRALKKQKQEEDEEKEETKPAITPEKADKEEVNEVAAVEDKTKSSKKKRKKGKKTKTDETVEEKTKDDNKEDEEEKDVDKQQKKKKKKSKANKEEEKSSSTNTTNETKEEKKKFIASKKFKGAKAGYAFRMGDNGLGYYMDAGFKPDPMLMTLIKSHSPKSGGGRGAGGNKRRNSKSPGRRKGRR